MVFNFISLRGAVAALGLCSSGIFRLALASLCAIQEQDDRGDAFTELKWVSRGVFCPVQMSACIPHQDESSFYLRKDLLG